MVLVKDFDTITILDANSKLTGKDGHGPGGGKKKKITTSPSPHSPWKSAMELGVASAQPPIHRQCSCAQMHTRAIVLCSDSPSTGKAAGEPSRNKPNNSHVNVQSAYTEWTWGGEAGVCTIRSTLDIVSNKSFHNLSENITSPRNRALITSLRSFSKACNVYFDPHHHTHTNSNTTFPWKH